jgi:hypothetical protein
LTAAISDEEKQEWSLGTASDWATESFGLARRDAYGLLPEASTTSIYVITDRYIEAAAQDVVCS